MNHQLDFIDERRVRPNRRTRVWWSVLYGNFMPRRRRLPRRADESGFHTLDLHAAHLLAVAIAILLLSCADAFMTVTLMGAGAIEVNPIMATFMDKSSALFAAVKMGMTGIGVAVMIMLAHYRLMKVLPVQAVLYAILAIYTGLLYYEYGMLRSSFDVLSF